MYEQKIISNKIVQKEKANNLNNIQLMLKKV